MGKLKVMWSIFWSEKFVRLYMVFFVLLIIITSNISVTLLKEAYTLKRIGDKCDFDNAVYFSKSSSILPYAGGGESEYAQKVNRLLSEIKEQGQDVGEITYLYTYVDALEENAFLLNYDETILHHVELPLSKGNWFQENGNNEAVLSYGYKDKYRIGDMLTFVVTGENRSCKEVTVEVIGFLDKDNYVLNFNASGYVDMNALFAQNESVIITNRLYTSEGEEIRLMDNAGDMIFDTTIDSNYSEKLKEIGSVTAMEEIAETYSENSRERFQSQIGIEMVLLILAISGLGSMNFISLYTKRKEYGVYFICGLSAQAVLAMTALMNVFVVAAAFVPIILLCLILPDMVSNIDYFNILITVGIVAFILFVTFIPFYCIMKKESIINLTRR